MHRLLITTVRRTDGDIRVNPIGALSNRLIVKVMVNSLTHYMVPVGAMVRDV
jgi:hypothetical protein